MPTDRVFFIGMIVFSGLVFLNMVRIQVGLHAGGAADGQLVGYSASPRVREMVAEAKNIQQRHGFVLFMEFSAGYAQMAQSWLCNTRGMDSVHSATLMSTDDEGFRQMRSFIANQISPTATHHLPTVVRNPLPERYQGSWRYGSVGYWTTVQYRVHTLTALLDAGVDLLVAEPDAVWIRNPLEDPDLMDRSVDIVGISDGSGGIGFGFIRIKSNKATRRLFERVRHAFDAEMRAAARMQPTRSVQVRGEQQFFTSLLEAGTQSGALSSRILDGCAYPNGQWYDGGRGVDPEEYRSPCAASGGGKQIIVLQNNWIAGNDAKVSRARRWGHWFLDDGNLEPSTSTGAACLPLAHLADAVQTVLTAVPPGGPPTDIEMHRRR